MGYCQGWIFRFPYMGLNVLLGFPLPESQYMSVMKLRVKGFGFTRLSLLCFYQEAAQDRIREFLLLGTKVAKEVTAS